MTPVETKRYSALIDSVLDFHKIACTLEQAIEEAIEYISYVLEDVSDYRLLDAIDALRKAQEAIRK